jgi:uncharacterized protein YbcI
MDATQAISPRPPDRGKLLEQLTSRLVRCFADHAGRGPTKARTVIADDIVVCVMEDFLTRPERTVVGRGHLAEIGQVREAIHEVIKPLAAASVSTVLEQPVEWMTFGVDLHAEQLVLTFGLRPEGELA